MAINSALFLLGLNVNGFVLDPDGLPVGATGFINFSDLTFYFEGGEDEISEVLSDDPDFGDFNIANVIEGTGLVGGPTSKPRIIGTPATQMLAGSTMVFDFLFNTGVEGYYTVTLYDGPDFNITWGCAIASTEAGFDSSVYASLPPTAFPDTALGAHLGALTITSSGAKACIGGGTVYSDAGDSGDFADLAAIGMEIFANTVLRSIAIYPPMSDAEMQAHTA